MRFKNLSDALLVRATLVMFLKVPKDPRWHKRVSPPLRGFGDI